MFISFMEVRCESRTDTDGCRLSCWDARYSARTGGTWIGSGKERRSANEQCYAGADETSQCIAQKEDYLECLHRTKEVS